MSTELIINTAIANWLPRFIEQIQRAVAPRRGQYKVEIKRHSGRRTNPQNAFYWSAYCTAVSNFLNEQGESYGL
ncbi:MAG: hypothetical protein JO353_10940, partial [Phycisphaerae bacterium]|nr:hypothetical protein [Phycisphaerae bacterium]